MKEPWCLATSSADEPARALINLCAKRWQIERMFNRLKDFRRIATRYDRLARNFASAIALVAVVLWWTD
jgi:transposase